MIAWGLAKPVFLGGEESTSWASVTTSGWSAIAVPPSKSGVASKYVVLSVGPDASPASAAHLYLGFGQSAGGYPSAVTNVPIVMSWQLPIVLDVTGYAYVYARAVNRNVEVFLTPAETDLCGNVTSMVSPPKISAPGINLVISDSGAGWDTIPNDASGRRARYIMVTHDTSSACIYLAPFPLSNLPYSPIWHFYPGPLIFDVAGYTTIYARRATGSGAMNVRITPVEKS